MSELFCKRCGSTNVAKVTCPPPHRKKTECADCGAWIKWGWGDASWSERAESYLATLTTPEAAALVAERRAFRGR